MEEQHHRDITAALPSSNVPTLLESASQLPETSSTVFHNEDSKTEHDVSEAAKDVISTARATSEDFENSTTSDTFDILRFKTSFLKVHVALH